MRLHVLQHVGFEGPARIDTWAQAGQHAVTVTRFFANETLPAVDAFDFLLVMGGPMGANDDRRFPWMKSEKALIAEAIEQKKKVLGVCLGAQLIAAVAGARVYPNREKEIGWWPIELDPPNVRHHAPMRTLPQRVNVFHWHGDTFDLPKGAVHLARSRACENQAFAIGDHILGLQFHIEVAAPQIEQLLHHAASDLTNGAFVQDPHEIISLTATYAPPANAILNRLLDAFAAPRESI